MFIASRMTKIYIIFFEDSVRRESVVSPRARDPVMRSWLPVGNRKRRGASETLQAMYDRLKSI